MILLPLFPSIKGETEAPKGEVTHLLSDSGS